jgi:hypothetical protein
MSVVKKGPDVASASRVGEPNLVETTPMAARDVIRSEAMGAMGPAQKGVLGVEIVKPDQPVADAAPPSDAAPGGSPFGQPGPVAADPNELKPNNPDPNELKPAADIGSEAALPPPPQVNEIQSGASSSSATADSTPATDQEISSSKKKKKTGLKKIIPF